MLPEQLEELLQTLRAEGVCGKSPHDWWVSESAPDLVKAIDGCMDCLCFAECDRYRKGAEEAGVRVWGVLAGRTTKMTERAFPGLR